MIDRDRAETTATVLAMSASRDDPAGPAFDLGLGDSTVGRSMVDELRSAGITVKRVLTRQGWERAASATFGDGVSVVAVDTVDDAVAALGDLDDRDVGPYGHLLVTAHAVAPAHLLRSLARYPSPASAVLLLDDEADGRGFGVTVVDGHVGGFSSEDAASGIVWLPAGKLTMVAAETDPPVSSSGDPSAECGEDLVIAARVVARLLDLGAPVRTVSPRHGSVDLIRDAPDAHRFVDRRACRFSDDDARMHDAVKAWDGWFTTFLVSPYTRYVARWLGRRNVAPNTVTLASLIVALATAGLVLLDRTLPMIAAALLLQMSFALDCVDGQLARYSARFSRAGAWFDIASDRVKEFAVMLALASTVGSTTVWLAASTAFALQTMRHLTNVGFRRRPAENAAFAVPVSIVAASARRGRDRPLGGFGYWLRRLVSFSIGERLALLSVAMLSGAIEPMFWVYAAWVAVAALSQFVGRRRRQQRRPPRLSASDLDLTFPVRRTASPLPGADLGLVATTMAAVAVVARSSLDVPALVIWWIAVIVLAPRARPRSAAVVAAVDFATVIVLLASRNGTDTRWQLGLLAAVLAVAWADRGYWDDYAASPPVASTYLRLGVVPRQSVMLVGAALGAVEITAIGVASLVGLSVVWGWLAAARQLSGSRVGETAAVSLS